MAVAEGGRFTHRVAAALVQALTINLYDAPDFLSGLFEELRHTLAESPISYAWGTLQAGDDGISLAVVPAQAPKARQTAESTFYRDLSET